MQARTTSLGRVLFLAILTTGALGTLARTAAGAGAECGDQYQQLARETRENVESRFEKRGSPHPADHARDWASEQLQWVHGRAYPIANFDDATPLKAKSLAQQSYGLSKGEQAFPLKELQSELAQTIERVEKFGGTYNEYVKETAERAIRLKRMEELALGVIPRTGEAAKNIEVEMPFIEKLLYDEKGAFKDFQIGQRKEYFGNRNEFLLELQGLQGSLKERLKTPFWGLSSEAQVIGQQAQDLEKLRTFFSAARSVQSRAPETASLDPDTSALYQRVAKLFEGGDDPARRWQEVIPGAWNPQNKATRLPYWAWRDLRWKDFWGEIRGIFQKDLPRLSDAAKNDKILQALRSLTPEEQRALGIGDLASSASFLASNKWLNILLGLGGGGWSVGELSLKGFKYFLADPAAKEKCAAEAGDEKFVGCMQSYLAGKYGQSAPALEQLTKANLRSPARIRDEAIRLELEDAVRRRKRYQGGEAQKAAALAAYAKSARQVLALEDPTSQAFRQRVVTSSDDAVFLIGLLGSPQKPGLLPATYPGPFAAHEELVRKILKETNPQARTGELNSLRAQGAASLAEALAKLLSDRQRTMQNTRTSVR